jgi:hypothetical protein
MSFVLPPIYQNNYCNIATYWLAHSKKKSLLLNAILFIFGSPYQTPPGLDYSSLNQLECWVTFAGDYIAGTINAK